jgi:IS30 family transposase
MPTLAAVYADAKLTSRNPKILAKRAGTTAASAKRFLANQASSQIREQYVRPDSSVYSPTGAPQDFYQGDAVYFDILRGANKGHRSMLTIMNTTTRYVYARPLRTTTAAAAAEAMRSILDSVAARGKKMVSLRVDGGVEFKGVFKALMADRKIALLTGEANTHSHALIDFMVPFAVRLEIILK